MPPKRKATTSSTRDAKSRKVVDQHLTTKLLRLLNRKDSEEKLFEFLAKFVPKALLDSELKTAYTELHDLVATTMSDTELLVLTTVPPLHVLIVDILASIIGSDHTDAYRIVAERWKRNKPKASYPWPEINGKFTPRSCQDGIVLTFKSHRVRRLLDKALAADAELELRQGVLSALIVYLD